MKRVSPVLQVASIETSLEFYTQVLGFDLDFTMPNEDGKVVYAGVRSNDMLLMFGMLDDMVSPAARPHLGAGVSLYFEMAEGEDLDAYFQTVKAAGATITQVPTDQFWDMRDFGLTDPDGYVLAVSQTIPARVDAVVSPDRALVGAPAD